MIGPSPNFTDLGIVVRYLDDNEKTPNPNVTDTMTALGLHKGDSDFVGSSMLFMNSNGQCKRIREHSKLYSLVKPGDERLGAEAHMAYIAREHGAGTVWFLDDPVHLVRDDERIVVQEVDGSGERFYLLRTFYGHESQAVDA